MTSDVEILRIHPFQPGEGHGRASVTLRCGPVIVYGKILEKEGRRWLSLPARKDSNDKWHDLVQFQNRTDHQEVESAVVRAYDRLVGLPEEELAASA